MNKSVGFIGCGNMAKAMIAGFVGAGADPNMVIVSNPSETSLEMVHRKFSVQTTHNNREVAQKADILILSVKPYLYEDVIYEIRDVVKKDVIIVLVAAGQSLNKNMQRFGREIKMVRSMPNTPAMVGEGMSAICPNSLLSSEEIADVKSIFDSFGKTEFVNENQMDVVAGVSGSSPAYVYLFIEALADGAVLEGMPRKLAYTFAAQAVFGAAKMVLDSGVHPGALKDAVCSPGGTTIKAIAALENGAMRSTVIKAVSACVNKSREMSD